MNVTGLRDGRVQKFPTLSDLTWIGSQPASARTPVAPNSEHLAPPTEKLPLITTPDANAQTGPPTICAEPRRENRT